MATSGAVIEIYVVIAGDAATSLEGATGPRRPDPVSGGGRGLRCEAHTLRLCRNGFLNRELMTPVVHMMALFFLMRIARLGPSPRAQLSQNRRSNNPSRKNPELA